jgi:hypothetical protein
VVKAETVVFIWLKIVFSDVLVNIVKKLLLSVIFFVVSVIISEIVRFLLESLRKNNKNN